MHAAEVTFAILTRNEAHRLPQTLRALPAGAPVFVLDAESTDATVAVAREHGARCEIRPWQNFVEARRYLLAQISTPWVFMLDADERPDAALLAALGDCAGLAQGYRCLRENWFCGKAVRGGAWAGEYVLRLARSEAAYIDGGRHQAVHESLAVPSEVGLLDGRLLHDSYPDIASYWRKFARYTDIEAAAEPAGSIRALCTTALRASARGLWHFAGRGGFRDGWRGLFIAAASAWYPVVVQWKALRRSCA